MKISFNLQKLFYKWEISSHSQTFTQSSHHSQTSINFLHKSTLIYLNPNNFTFLSNHFKSPSQSKHIIMVFVWIREWIVKGVKKWKCEDLKRKLGYV